MPTLREARASLVAVSRRYSRVAHEVEDLAHDLIVSALRRGSGLDADALLRNAHGAARRHGAFLARSAGRRRAREASSAAEHVAGEEDEAVKDDAGGGAPVSALSPALRTTLFLLLLGLEKAELRAALGLTDAALRKRFQALREHGPLARPELPVAERPPALRQSQVGLLPRLARGDRAARVLSAGDPDGHGIIFAEVLTERRPAATTEAPPTHDGTRSKGDPC
jgi:DNA-directed RNA polymerase specialized sigma24 family protein